MSCLIRNDYNVIFSFFILIILNNFYNNNTKFFTKVIIHTLVFLILADTIWLIVMLPHWSHDDKKDYWNSLSTLHTFVTILAFIELGLKALIVFYLFTDYKGKNSDICKYN